VARPRLVTRRRVLVTLAAVVVLLAGAAATLVVAAPVVAAAACPGCHGLESLGDGVWVEPGTDHAAVRADLAAADRRLRAFFGDRLTAPRVLICHTDACYRRIGGGGEKGQALRDWALLLSPGGANAVIAAHELTHVEVFHRLDGGDLPSWFDEGLAVLVSDDPRYLDPGPDRCQVDPAAAAEVTRGPWHGSIPTYRLAACAVSRWVTARGGPPAVLDLIANVRDGAEPGTAIGPVT
jgi:hypothetical protein